ncbi:hypothetical protein ACIQ2D_02910 [Lysinibacillus sp. NPDC097287]|uniref:hypothetical protein n=1 Tax=Lysinibacillus sp. NPDC097287 TaxID=3364144 RepID=UPI0038094741
MLDISVLLQQINLRKDYFFILLLRQREYPKEKGYDVAVQEGTSSDKKIVVTLVLPHDEFDSKTKEEVPQIATDVIIKNKFEPETFQFNFTSYIKY